MAVHLIQRALLLLQQQKYKEAENILRALFAEHPTDTQIMGLLCEVKINQEQYEEAMSLVNNAIGIQPDDDRLFYSRARIFLQTGNLNEAVRDLQQSIALDPFDPDYPALLALVKINHKDYEAALQLADSALELNPQHLNALNARSKALLKLDRKDESFQTIEGALREDPDNAFTHANYGWGLLEKGSNKQALHHFSEALRKEPNLEYAQSGMAEALKSRYFIYRGYLKFSFWMGNLQSKYQWGFIIGFYFLFQVVKAVSRANPTLQPFLIPVIVLLVLFALSTWLMKPLGNLFLRLNRYGRHLLTKEEKYASNLVGFFILTGIAGLLVFLLSGQIAGILLIVFGITMTIPASVAFSSTSKRYVLKAYAGLLAMLGLTGIVMAFTGFEIFNVVVIAYLVGFFLFQWIANYLIFREKN
jgi:tetratricopeptide (TPR) repeat protein